MPKVDSNMLFCQNLQVKNGMHIFFFTEHTWHICFTTLLQALTQFMYDDHYQNPSSNFVQ